MNIPYVEAKVNLDLSVYRAWLAAALETSKAYSRSSFVSIRKSADLRVDELVGAIALLEEYLSSDVMRLHRSVSWMAYRPDTADYRWIVGDWPKCEE